MIRCHPSIDGARDCPWRDKPIVHVPLHFISLCEDSEAEECVCVHTLE